MIRSMFNLDNLNYYGISLLELSQLAEITIYRENKISYPVYSRQKNYSKQLKKSYKKNKKIKKLYKKIDKIKSKIIKLYGMEEK